MELSKRPPRGIKIDVPLEVKAVCAFRQSEPSARAKLMGSVSSIATASVWASQWHFGEIA